MTILDQPSEKVAQRKKITLFEAALATALIFFTISHSIVLYTIHEVGIARISMMSIGVPGLILSCGYFFGYYWIDKPAIADGRAIFLCILYGIGFSVLTASWIEFAINVPMAPGSALTGIGLVVTALVLDLISSSGNERVASKLTFIRALVFGTVLLIFFIIKG